MNIVRLLFLTILAIGITIPAPTFAQGTFFARNFSPIANVNAPIFDANGNRLFGSDFVAMLYGGQATNSLMPALNTFSMQTMAPVPFTSTGPGGQLGYFNGSSVAIPNVRGSTAAWLQVVAWDRRLGNTYEEAVAMGMGGYGASDLFQWVAGCPDCTLPTVPSSLVGLQSFSLLAVVPEPGAGLLLLLGLPFLAARWLKSRRTRK